MGEERDYDDIHVSDARRDGVRTVEERDAAQSPHGHGYSYTHETLDIEHTTNHIMTTTQIVSADKLHD